ncbi:glycine--tRNA ligase subunit beta [Candidatus Thiosymbion oneisti]|uniref:glycine--tRNA ligase subunit beta n=1 Tax=Candidatus Thiosymbion oneisti TaxID=589554 RepID=UPI000AEE0EEB|nr:glycine--tRNA ligase subunit beta [Candidatus Thiosymbion oneisti]
MEETHDLLVEIGTEELPPKPLQVLSEAFKKGLEDQLRKHELGFSWIEPFATPRRLGLLVRELATRQPDQEIVRKGPALQVAFDTQGQPTRAASGFARSCGVSVKELQQEETSKGAWLVFRQVQQGRNTMDLIVDMTAKALEALPIPKRMRWGEQDDEFVRPVHWVTIVFGEDPVEGRLFSINAGRLTRGHRFQAPVALPIPSASQYAEILRTQGKVEPSFSTRREMIRNQVQALAEDASGQAIMEDDLLDEVTALCEWPYAIMGAFDEGFLEMPSEVLIETMQKHQKYFPLVSSNGRLLPHFITISNIQSRDPAQIRAGNERVIRPRFSDAAFFLEQDLKQPLQAFEPKLEKVIFQERLGTLAEKSARLGRISGQIASLLGIDQGLAIRAAQLAKCDLVTQMVLEFPGLQGTIGRYYAWKAGENPCVVSAMEQQYLPRRAGDELPQSDCGLVLSIADRLDTLVGIFAIGQRPTGVRDPYALRRAAIGLLRILIETPLSLDLREILNFSSETLKDKVDTKGIVAEVFEYCMERLKGYYLDQNIRADIVDSVLAVNPTVPSDIHRRILAVEDFRSLPEAAALTAANKRIRNILRKHSESIPERIDTNLLQDDAERRLEARITSLASGISPFLKTQDYKGILKMLSELHNDIDTFFDKVMVMTEQSDLRRNRLTLLRDTEALFLKVADISFLKSEFHKQD